MELWADESGEPTFTNMEKPLFIVGTMVCDDAALANELLSLRVRLTKQGYDLPDGFHANETRPEVRTKVIDLLSQRSVRTYASVYDKRQVPGEYKEPDQFYWWAWYKHHKYFLPGLIGGGSSPFMAIATYGTDSQRAHLEKALRTGIKRSLPEGTLQPVFAYWPSSTHPCLQAVDHILWAIQRAEVKGDYNHRNRLKRQIQEVRYG
jgi:hypothetical protein